MSRPHCEASEIVRDNYEARNFYLATEWKDHHAYDSAAANGATRPVAWPAPRPGAGPTGRQTFRRGAASISNRLLGSFGFGTAARTRSPSARRRRLRLPAPPASARPKRQSRLSAKLAVEDFAYQGDRFRGIDLRLRVGRRAHDAARHSPAASRPGSFTPICFDAPNDFRLNIDSSIVPSALWRRSRRPGFDRFSASGNGSVRRIFTSHPRDEPDPADLARRRHPGARSQRAFAGSG